MKVSVQKQLSKYSDKEPESKLDASPTLTLPTKSIAITRQVLHHNNLAHNVLAVESEKIRGFSGK